MNLLISLIGNSYDDAWLAELLDKLNIEICIVLVRDKKTADNSVVIQKYATHVFYHDKLKVGDYSDVMDLFNGAPPVDMDLLESFAKYESQLFWMMERCVSVEYNHRWTDYIKHVRFWDYVLDKFNIDLFLAKSAPHEVYDYVIYVLSQGKNIKYLAGHPMAYYQRMDFVTDIYEQHPLFYDFYKMECKKWEMKSCEEIPLSKEMEEVYNFYVGNGDRTPFYMKSYAGQFRNQYVEWIYYHFAIARFFRSFKNSDGVNSYARKLKYYIHRIRLGVQCLLRVADFSEASYAWFENHIYINRTYHEDEIAINYYKKQAVEVDYGKKYIYVALHMQPENTSSPLGGIYVDQALMVETLSYYAPEGWVIYVKDHPNQIKQSFITDTSYRTIGFYQRMLELPNVKFVSFNEDTFRLIENAQAVASLTGTVGLEAVTKGIPFLMFGYGYMQYAPNVCVIRSTGDCIKAMAYLQKATKVDDDYYKNMKIFFKVLEQSVYRCTTEWYTLRQEELEENKALLINAYSERLMAVFGKGIFKGGDF